MGIIEEIGQMQDQGLPDEQILANLQERGYTPKDINDAINQIQVKAAVGNEGAGQDAYAQQNYDQQGYDQSQGAYAQQQGYEQQGYDQQYTPTNQSDTLIEVAEQVFNEKIGKVQDDIAKLNQFQTIAQGRIDAISESLRKIESTIDQLQIEILKKVGSYGNSIEGIKDEMSMMQDSFTKMINQKVSKKSSKK